MTTFFATFYYESLLIGLVIVLLTLVYLLYYRVPADQACLRVGLGKPKVLMQKGSFVIPFLHTLTPVSLHTFSLELVLQGQKSLFTKDPIRVDVHLVCSVRVAARPDCVLTAVHTWGGSDQQWEMLKPLLLSEATSVLSMIITLMPLENLHLYRTDVLETIQRRLNLQWQKYGLELVSASLVNLTQTDKSYYDPTQVMDNKALLLLEKRQIDLEKQRQVQHWEAKAAFRRREFEAAVQHMMWERDEFTARLHHIRFKAEADAKAEQEIEEIQLAKALALEMVQRDVQLMRIQTEQELAAAQNIAQLKLVSA